MADVFSNRPSPGAAESPQGHNYFGAASLPVGHRAGLVPTPPDLHEALLISTVRDHVRQFSSMTEGGNGLAALSSLIETARADPSASDLDGSVKVEGARVLLRVVGDPGLIVPSRGFVPLVGLSDSVAIERAARSIHQHGTWSRATKELLANLPTYTPSELDRSLPPLSPRARELFIEPEQKRFRELPDENGMADRSDDSPRFRRLVEKRGVGACRYELPKGVGVKQTEPIKGVDLQKVEELLASVDAYRVDGPRILSLEEIAMLSDGRRAPSRSRLRHEAMHRDEHALIASEVNGFVRTGTRFGLDLVQPFSAHLLTTSRPAVNAGRLRCFENFIENRGEAVFFAPPELILPYLNDLMVWHDANKDTMHPVMLAALTYQQFVRVHPLPDGNGRVGRALMDVVLQENGYLPPTFSGIDERTITDRSAQVVMRVAHGVLNASSLLAQ